MMGDEEFQELEREKHLSIVDSALNKSKNNVDSKKPLTGLIKQSGVMAEIGSYLSPEDGENLLKANPGFFARKDGGSIGKQFTQRQREFAATLNEQFSILLDESTALWEDQGFTQNLYKIYPKDTADILVGCLAMAAGQYQDGLKLFEGKDLSKSIQERLNDDAYKGKLGFKDKTERKKYLEDRVTLGDKHAQERLNQAAYDGKLGFTDKTGKEYLEDRVKDHQDKDAQLLLNKAAYEGDELGFTDKTGKEYLEDRVNNHQDKNAQEWLNLAASWGDKLGFTDKSGKKYLKKIASDEKNPGRQSAQEQLNEAAYMGTLGLGKKYLKERVNNHQDKHAQEKLNWAAYHGKFGFDNDKGKKYLEDRAKLEDKHAQERLNWAALCGKLGFDNETGREYLEDRVNNHQDKNAQEKLNEAASDGKLGFTDETGREYLEDRVKLGDKNAQEKLNEAASDGKLGFTNEKDQREYLEQIVLDEKNPGRQDAQEKLNLAALSCKLGFSENENLPWFFEFYNLVQNMGKVPVIRVQHPQIVENNIIENNVN